MLFRPLPWDYGVRNLWRRPGRSALTMLGLATVVFLVLLVTSFVRGLESSLATSGDQSVVLVHSLGASENIENSTMPGRAPGLLAASLRRIDSRFGERYVSPELYLGTEVRTPGRDEPAMGIASGVTPATPLVRKQFQLLSGRWPQAGEVLVGRLAAAKLGLPESELAEGRTLHFESRDWTVCGQFATSGSALESELWCRLEDLQQAMKRQDLSLVAVSVMDPKGIADLSEFCKERLDLEWQATPE